MPGCLHAFEPALGLLLNRLGANGPQPPVRVTTGSLTAMYRNDVTCITAASDLVRHFAEREKKRMADSNFLANGWSVAVRERGPNVCRVSPSREELSAGADRLGRNFMRAIPRRPASEQHGAIELIRCVGLEFSHRPPRIRGCETWTSQRPSRSARPSDGALVSGALLRGEPMEQRIQRNHGATPVSGT